MDALPQLIDIAKYVPWVPQELWPILSIGLAATLLVIQFAGNVIDFLAKLKNLNRKDVPTPSIVEQPVRVLQAVWLKDRQRNLRDIPNPQKSGVPVISFINMKGGVGKTTLAANVGAYFLNKGKRVLFIDFDYQGTLSLMVASAAKRSRLPANSYHLLYNEDPEKLAAQAHRFDGQMQNASLFAAHYVLFRDEMQLFAEWATEKLDFDVRYSLARTLQDKRFYSNWDCIIIDCGPRFTTSTINALTASTHVVIPTILDEPSAQAVGYLSKEFLDHKDELFPYLKLLGVVPTMVTRDPIGSKHPQFNRMELEQIDALKTTVEATWGAGSHVLADARIPRRAGISQHANEIAYFADEEAERVFSRAAKILEERLKK